ncbi:MAG: DUF2752 domain-containing protein, partial [Sphingobacteriales bacterium]
RRAAGQTGLGRVGQEPRVAGLHVEAGRGERLGQGAVVDGGDVVEEHPVVLRAVADVGLQDEQPCHPQSEVRLLLGWLWLYWSFGAAVSPGGSLCLFRNLTGLPCPSCGTTRSAASIFKGEFLVAASQNPLGFIVSSGLLVLPVWITADLISGRATLFQTATRWQQKLQTSKWILAAFLLIIAIIWIWNLYKHFT